jgi:hypothetical protein
VKRGNSQECNPCITRIYSSYSLFCFPQGHINISLIDYIAEKIVNNPQILEECRASSFLSLVSGMANAGYKPVGWNCIQEALMRNKTLIKKVGQAVVIMYGNSCTVSES